VHGVLYDRYGLGDVFVAAKTIQLAPKAGITNERRSEASNENDTMNFALHSSWTNRTHQATM
jgi:hypothetical protein